MQKTLIGKIVHFYPKISVAVIELQAGLKVGQKISVEKEDKSFEQMVDSMQSEHKSITEAKSGDSIGLKLIEPTREGARVFIVVE